MQKADCVFCKIAKGELSAYTVYEDNEVKAFLDLSQANEGHTLIIPKQHYESIYDIPDKLLKKIVSVSKMLAMKYQMALHTDGMNIIQSSGNAAQQEIFHYHMHLIPRYKGDQTNIRWTVKGASKESMKKTLKKITK